MNGVVTASAQGASPPIETAYLRRVNRQTSTSADTPNSKKKVRAKSAAATRTTTATGVSSRNTAAGNSLDISSESQFEQAQKMIAKLRKAHDKEKALKEEALESQRLAQTQVKQMKLALKGFNDHLEDQRKIRMMEERAATHVKRVNELKLENRELKEMISALSGEQKGFNNAHQGLVNTIQGKETVIDNLNVRLKQAEKEKDIANNQVAAITKKVEIEKRRWMEEVAELRRYIENDKRVKEMYKQTQLNGKTNDKGLTEAEKKYRTEVVEKWRAMAELGNPLVQDKMATVDKFRDRLQEITGATDLDSAISIFVHSEDINYKLLQLITETTANQNDLYREIAELRDTMEQYKTASAMADTQSSKRVIRQLEDQYEDALADLTRLRDERHQSDKTMANILAGIRQLGQLTGTHSNDMTLNDVNTTNYMSHLGMLEQRCNELMEYEAAIVEGRELSGGAMHTSALYTHQRLGGTLAGRRAPAAAAGNRGRSDAGGTGTSPRSKHGTHDNEPDAITVNNIDKFIDQITVDDKEGEKHDSSSDDDDSGSNSKNAIASREDLRRAARDTIRNRDRVPVLKGKKKGRDGVSGLGSGPRKSNTGEGSRGKLHRDSGSPSVPRAASRSKLATGSAASVGSATSVKSKRSVTGGVGSAVSDGSRSATTPPSSVKSRRRNK